MSSARIGRWLRANSPLVTLLTVSPLIVVILALTACVKYPIGDPEKSEVDPGFVGAWGDEQNLWIFRPYDSRTYLITALSYKKEGDEYKAVERTDFKAWLTPVGDATFITMEPMTLGHSVGIKEKPPYLVAAIAKVGDDLQLRFVESDNESVKAAENSKQFEAAVREHVDSDSLYIDDGSSLERIKDKTLIAAVLAAFPKEFPD